LVPSGFPVTGRSQSLTNSITPFSQDLFVLTVKLVIDWQNEYPNGLLFCRMPLSVTKLAPAASVPP
jgi:hypothetical protein